MKSIPALKPALILVIFTGMIIFSSCKKTVINEVKVPDFVTLSSQFNNPPAEYTTAPFFVWNGRNNQRRDRQVSYQLSKMQDPPRSLYIRVPD